MAKKDNKPTMDKEDFIKTLSAMSKDDIDRLIKSNGKSPKPVSPLLFYKGFGKN